MLIWIVGVSLVVIVIGLGDYWRNKIIWQGIEERERLRKNALIEIIHFELDRIKGNAR